jgi:hypothetical protein
MDASLRSLLRENRSRRGQASLAFPPDGRLVGMVMSVSLPKARGDERFSCCMSVNVAHE